MVDSNTNNDQSSNDQSNNQQQNTGSNAASGKKIVLGADGGCSQEDCDAIKKALESCGNTVTFTQIGPNQESYMKGHGADIGVFFVNGVAPATMWSFVNAIKAGSLPYTIFAHPGWAPYHDPGETSGTLASLETVRAVPYKSEWDAGQFMTAAAVAQMEKDGDGATTIGEWADKNSQYFALCWGASAEELAQNICTGACGNGAGGGSVVSSGGGAQIKDKTFEKCIRRICAATDSVFLVENNAAVLFPYTDWLAFTLREKISTITPKEIDPDVFSMEYNNEGTYNKVSIAWGGETLPERFPNNPLMHEKYLEKQKNKQTETTVTKKNGTTQKNTTSPDGTNILSEQYDLLVKKYGELEKRVESPVQDYETAQYLVNALLIQYVRDFNNSCECRALGNRRYIGGTFYIVTNPFTYEKEMLYLNGYTVRTQKDEPIYFDLDFRYGPESAEELLDYQFYTGGSGAVSSGTTGESSTEAEIWQHASKFCHFWSCGELREAESDTNDPQTAVDYVKKKEAANTPKICLSCYGMSAWLYYYFNNNAKIPCRVIFGGGHKVVELYKDNKWYKPIEEYRQLDEGFRYNEECKASNVEVTLQPPGGSP